MARQTQVKRIEPSAQRVNVPPLPSTERLHTVTVAACLPVQNLVSWLLALLDLVGVFFEVNMSQNESVADQENLDDVTPVGTEVETVPEHRVLFMLNFVLYCLLSELLSRVL